MPWFRGSILWTFFPIQLSLSLARSRSLSRSRARSVGNNLLVVMYSSCMQVPIRRSVLKRGFMYIRMHLKNSAHACGEKSISKIFGCLVRRLAHNPHPAGPMRRPHGAVRASCEPALPRVDDRVQGRAGVLAGVHTLVSRAWSWCSCRSPRGRRKFATCPRRARGTLSHTHQRPVRPNPRVNRADAPLSDAVAQTRGFMDFSDHVRVA